MGSIALVFSIIAMGAAGLLNLVLVSMEEYSNPSNRNTYKELLWGGSILMLFYWIISVQRGEFDLGWIHIICIAYIVLFFIDILVSICSKPSAGRDIGNLMMIRAEVKKSSLVIAVIYLAFGYLVS